MIVLFSMLYYIFSTDILTVFDSEVCLCFALAIQKDEKIKNTKLSKPNFEVEIEDFKAHSLGNTLFEKFKNFQSKNLKDINDLSYVYIEVFLNFKNNIEKFKCEIVVETNIGKIITVGPFMFIFNKEELNYKVSFSETLDENLTCINLPQKNPSKSLKGLFYSSDILKEIEIIISERILKRDKKNTAKCVHEGRFIEKTPDEINADKNKTKFVGEFPPTKKTPSKKTNLTELARKNKELQIELGNNEFYYSKDGSRDRIKRQEKVIKSFRERQKYFKSKGLNNIKQTDVPPCQNLFKTNEKFNRKKISIEAKEIRDCVDKVLNKKMSSKSALEEYEEIVKKRIADEASKNKKPEVETLKAEKAKFLSSYQILFLIYGTLFFLLIVILSFLYLLIPKGVLRI